MRNATNSDRFVGVAPLGVALLFVVQALLTTRQLAQFGMHAIGLSATYAAAMLLCALLQTALLFFIYRRAQAARLSTGIVLAAAAIMGVVSLLQPCPQVDAYAYIAYAKLGSYWAAYVHAVPIHPAPGFETKMWLGLPPCVYGPLWVAWNFITVGFTPNFAVAFFVMRVLALGLIGVGFVALKKLDFDSATLAVYLLNPFLYFYYVIEAHNDLLALVLVLAGMAIGRRRPILGAIVAGAAALVKINFVLVATLALDRGKLSLQRMFIGLAAMLAFVAAVSLVFGGAPYLNAMLHTGAVSFSGTDARLHLIFSVSHPLLGVIAVIAAAAAFVANAFLPIAAFSFYSTASNIFAWYLAWCIPYAVRTPKTTGIFLAALPAIATFMDPQMSFYRSHPWLAIDLFTVVIIAVIAWQALKPLVGRRRYIPTAEL